MTDPVAQSRIHQLNDAEPDGDGAYVLYWMQQSQRTRLNHALEAAVRLANEHEKPLLVGFGLTPDYPGARRHHFRFLLEGLQDVESALRARGIGFVVRKGSPEEVARRLAGDAVLTVVDRGYLRHQVRWRRELSRRVKHRVIQVESDVVVPVEVASDKAEYAARTLRPKIRGKLDDFVADFRASSPRKSARNLSVSGLDLGSLEKRLDDLGVDRAEGADEVRLRGGEEGARRALRRFVADGLSAYEEERSDPLADGTSRLSPYLHFGQLSPVDVALAVRSKRGVRREIKEAFLEELVVRRELAVNFVRYTSDYDAFASMPGWARETLEEHSSDEREHVYTRKQLARAQTHDRYWNAAMTEMRRTGWLHNHLRMYWGKKILEWTNTPAYAYRVALDLNNEYFLDGRDPSSYANVGWLFGLHDRAWGERDVFGKVRSMTASGLERKFAIGEYVERVERRYGPLGD